MSRLLKAALLVVVCALILGVPSAWAYWAQDGMALCLAAGYQEFPNITLDGAGGAIVTWQDYRSGNYDIYAQRVNASGEVQWTADGVALCAATGDQQFPKIIPDGAGGAIVTWQDQRSGNGDIYAQRVNASGAVQWATDGVALSAASGEQMAPKIASDGAGGAIVTWNDNSVWHVYVQRVNASGTVEWTANGVYLPCSAEGYQSSSTIIPDGAGGAIVTWENYVGGGNPDIYAQRVNGWGTIQWTIGGVAICTAPLGQSETKSISDGAGGAIFTWNDNRNESQDIYTQRVNASGVVQWAADGVALCTTTERQARPEIVSDGTGGAIVTWEDYRGGVSYPDIYVQKVNALGAVQWTANGVVLCTASDTQWFPVIASDGLGGAIVTWMDERYGDWYGIYAQRVDAAGAVQWTPNGVPICTATGAQQYPKITAGEVGNAIITWQDERGGDLNIYAASVGASFSSPKILSVEDVPYDQGGLVRLTIERPKLDVAQEYYYPISTYNVWQRIDDPTLLEMVVQARADGAPGARMNEAPLKRFVDASSVSGWPIKELNGQYFLQSDVLPGIGAFPPGTWELLGSFAACQKEQYIYRASTLADSTASATPYSVYVVSAHTTTLSVWFVSAPDSGYSVDNISPGPPVGLVAEQSYAPAGLALSWNVNAESDLSYYAVYRGLSEDFMPGLGNRVNTPTRPEWFDGSWHWNNEYYYKISAVDVHGNESGFALMRPDDVTGNGTPKAPDASYLAQNYPNPFNPATRIAFGLAAPGRVSLRIHDAAGRLIRTLVNDEWRPGRYEETWDGCDSNSRAVASGVYFYRLDAGSFTQTRKMILLR